MIEKYKKVRVANKKYKLSWFLHAKFKFEFTNNICHCKSQYFQLYLSRFYNLSLIKRKFMPLDQIITGCKTQFKEKKVGRSQAYPKLIKVVNDWPNSRVNELKQWAGSVN